MSLASKPAVKVKGEVRREQIVQATLKIIAQKGVSSLTTSALAREVGISEANLYRHFRNKDEIYMATVSQVQDMISKNLEIAMALRSNPLEALKRFFSLQIELMEENNGIPRLMFSEELHVHTPMREKILETMYGVSEKLAGLIKDGQGSGSIRKDIDALTTVLMFVATIQGLAFRWSLGGFSFSLATEGMKTWKNYEKMIIVGQKTSRRIE